jgi:hypothetical protein
MFACIGFTVVPNKPMQRTRDKIGRCGKSKVASR